MSRIPNSAIPHAGDTAVADREEESGTSLKDRAGQIAEKARANPKTAVAAGAAVLAGAVAAAAIPLIRSRKSGGGGATKSRSSRPKKGS